MDSARRSPWSPGHTRSSAQMSPSIATDEAHDAEHCEEISHGSMLAAQVVNPT